MRTSSHSSSFELRSATTTTTTLTTTRRRRRRKTSVLVTNVARSKGLRRRSKDGPNRSGKVSFFITVTRRRNSSNGMDANTNNAKSKTTPITTTTTTNRDDTNDDSIVEMTSTNKETVAVIGTLDAFGGWDSRECLQLVQTPNDADKWTGKIDLSHDDASNKTELKLVLLDQFQNVMGKCLTSSK